MARGKNEGGHSPAMQQFFRAKAQYPDALLFFRMGDFYELFYDDARVASAALELTLTSRSKTITGDDIPMAGVPHHAAASYLARLVEKGFKVAICEQMVDPSTVKGIVPREVVRVVTPGVSLEPDALDARLDNTLVVIVRDAEVRAIASVDVTRLSVAVTELDGELELLAELTRLAPREILSADVASIAAWKTVFPRARVAHHEHEGDLERVLRGHVADGATLEALSALERRAVGTALAYAAGTQPRTELLVSRVERYRPADGLVLDDVAIKNLELLVTSTGEREGSLLSLVDHTATPMGARLLRRRLLAPLAEVRAIEARLERVALLVRETDLRRDLRRALSGLGDLERLATRAELGVATPRDLGALRDGLRRALSIEELLSSASLPLPLSVEIDATVVGLFHELDAALVEEPPPVAQAGIVRDGADARVDELRSLGTTGRDRLLALEARLREESGIASLKIGYTRVFGYYIEITRSNLKNAPSSLRRKQTIANGERFTTDELDELSTDILHAEDRARAREIELFEELARRAGRAGVALRKVAASIADLDVHASFAELAVARDYVRPIVDASRVLELDESRHPIVESIAPSGTFVPNDVRLDADGERLWVITGPNMAGKSTVMRQAALAVILAQAGGFVPAKRARIGVVDRIYTRVGASDNLSRGESTFMVEMRETAALLHGATARSLVILDEIGRGTSTFDGLAIAWAVVESLADRVACRALFATHYHELAALEATRAGVLANHNVSAREHGEDVVFLHRLTRGPSSRSYGLAVARLAGLPPGVLTRAAEKLAELEARAASTPTPTTPTPTTPTTAAPPARPAAPSHDVVLDELRDLDLEALSPLEVFVRVSAWRDRLRRAAKRPDR